MVKRKELKIAETEKAEYFLVDTEHKKYWFKGYEVDFAIYNSPQKLDELIAQKFEFLEKRELRPEPAAKAK